MNPLYRQLIIIFFVNIWSPAYLYSKTLELDPNQGMNPLDQYLEVLVDANRQWTINDIVSDQASLEFTPAENRLNYGIIDSAVWVRFALKNNSSSQMNYLVEVNYPLLDAVDFYYEDKSTGEMKKFRSGDGLGASVRVIKHPNSIFPVNLHANETRQFYFRFASQGTMTFPLIVWRQSSYIEHAHVNTLILGSYYGLMIAMILYNIFLFLSIKDISYFYYVLYLGGYVFFQLSLNGISYLYFWPDSPVWGNRSVIFFIGIDVFLAIKFSVHYLKISQIAPKLATLVNSLSILSLSLAALCFFISYSLILKITSIISFIALGTVILIGFRSLRAGYRPARYFLLAWVCLILGAMIMVFRNFGILPNNIITFYGAQIGSALEVILLSLGLGDRIRLQQSQAQEEITRLNEDLELKVENKTRDIRSILSNIQQGIFTIHDSRRPKISREYSNYLENILECKSIGDQDLNEVFLNHLEINADQKSQIESVIGSSLDAEELSFELNKHILPREYIFKKENGIKKTLETEWSTVTDDSNTVKKILVSIRDISGDRKLQEESKKNRRELEIIDEILGVKEEQFQRFIRNCNAFISQNQNLIKMNTSFKAEVIKVMFINLHTMKGLARAYGFTQLTGLVHVVEQKYSQIQSTGQGWSQEDLLADMTAIELVVEEYDTISRNKLGRGLHIEDVRVPLQLIKSTLNLINHPDPHSKNTPQFKDITTILKNIYYTDVKKVILEIMNDLPTLAKDLQKDIPTVEIVGENPGIDREGADILRNIHLHLVRNSMDHGIEKAAAREKHGKHKIGKITFHLNFEQDFFCIKFQDDGKGLDLGGIRTLCIDRGFISKDDSLSQLEIASLILKTGFSTASEITEISGRGIGMEAVKSYIEEAGGRFSIELHEKNTLSHHTPFSLKISLPLKYIQLS